MTFSVLSYFDLISNQSQLQIGPVLLCLNKGGSSWPDELTPASVQSHFVGRASTSARTAHDRLQPITAVVKQALQLQHDTGLAQAIIFR